VSQSFYTNLNHFFPRVGGDLSSIFQENTGAGTLVKDLTNLTAVANTLQDFQNIAAGLKGPINTAWASVASGLGDVTGIINGFDQGGTFGSIEAGWSAISLVKLVDSYKYLDSALKTLLASTTTVDVIGVVIALASLFLGGNHDNPTDMPDKYDTQRYGQGVANLQGAAAANSKGFTEDPNETVEFNQRTGIQAIEETLAMYGTAANAPAWLGSGEFNTLEEMFGESASGSGQLSVGLGGTGKDCDNQEIVGVGGVSGQEYNYLQLDTQMNDFMGLYVKAVADGQAVKMTYDPKKPVATPPQSADWGVSYQSEYDFSA